MSLPPALSSRISLASARLGRAFEALFGPVRAGASAISSRASAIVHPRQSVLTPAQVQNIANFANSDSMGDRNRVFSIEATVNGRRGRQDVSVNSVLRIEASYDELKRRAEALLAELIPVDENGVETGQGVLTYIRPAVAPDVRTIQDRRNRIGGWGPGGEHNNFCPPWGADSRVWTGGWFDFPRFADLGNQAIGYDEGATSFNYTRFNRGGYLPGAPLPSNWRKIYPTTRLFQRSAFGDEAFVRIISEMSTLGVGIIRGANGDPQWHPCEVYGWNGVEDYFHTGGVWDQVETRYQYHNGHPWARVTQGEGPSRSGIIELGRSDSLWIDSMRSRAPRIVEWRTTPAASHNWASQEYADAIADFVRAANILRMICDLGATAHVHACVEQHSAMLSKAMRELNLPRGAGIDQYLYGVAMERQAREARASAGNSNPTGLTLVSGASSSTDRQIANAVLNGAVVASVQLLMSMPLAGVIAVAITAVGILITNLVFGAAFECRGEQLLIRDGTEAVLSADINNCSGSQGNVYGGNYYPHKRIHAIQGRPVIRVFDSSGREIP